MPTSVSQLIHIAVAKGNKTRPGIKLGICGENGGDPDSVKFCHHAGLPCVSCSPYRVPVARLPSWLSWPAARCGLIDVGYHRPRQNPAVNLELEV